MRHSVLTSFLGLSLTLLSLDLELAEGFNDDFGVLKWNPLWLTYPKYSAPISDRSSSASRGYMYKRLMDERPYSNWNPYYSYNLKPLSSSGTRVTSPYYVQKRTGPASPHYQPLIPVPGFTGWKWDGPLTSSEDGLPPLESRRYNDVHDQPWEASE